MNLLCQKGLPFAIDGEPIYPSFRNMVRLEILLGEEPFALEIQTALALNLLYKNPPKELPKALEGLLWFYRCGQAAESSAAAPCPRPPAPAYCFKQDAPLIYAAFYSTYGINLNQIPFMHWWEFSALFTALPSSTRFMQVVNYRTAELDGMEENQRAFYQKMRAKYEIKRHRPVVLPTPGAQNAAMKNWVDERFNAAERKMNHGL